MGEAVKVGTLAKKGTNSSVIRNRNVVIIVAKFACLFLQTLEVDLTQAAMAEAFKTVLVAAFMVLVTKVPLIFGNPLLGLTHLVPEFRLARALTALNKLINKKMKMTSTTL